MRKSFAVLFVLALAGCASQPMIMSWKPVGTPKMPLEDARNECRFEVAKDPRTLDQLSVMAGQTFSNNMVRLNGYGANLFQLCMQMRGYQPAGMVPVEPGG